MVFLSPATHFGIHVFHVVVRACRVFDDNVSQNLSFQILVELISKGGTDKGVIEEKDLVQVSALPFVNILET